ncbi:MAG: hypothetical protein J6S54_01570 [Lentisphaeria bacterium]|nr:hypothetical protein [Lentisphaeria bacterium]
MKIWKKIFFDPGDRKLVEMVRTSGSSGEDRKTGEYASELHPRGIMELVEPRSFRIVRSVLTLLESVTPGGSDMLRRLDAIAMLRDEVCEGLNVPLKYNTARVLPELAKELCRVRHDPEKALRAAHDLRMALLGNPRFIRSQLKRFQLVEMPESSLPVSFDYHVHDANTKGRKSPSHLIMDAWIKGIRKLQVIFYNQVPPEGAFELMRSAEIMGIDVRIGIEFRVLHRNRFVELIWTPRGFSGADDFLNFLNNEHNKSFKARCEEASLYHTSLIFGMLRRFNAEGRKRLNAFYKTELPPLSDGEFSAFLPPGKRPSSTHAAEFIEHKLRLLLEEKERDLSLIPEPSEAEELQLRSCKRHLAALTPAIIRGNYLDRQLRDQVPADTATLPRLMRLSPRELAAELRKQSRSFRLTLNLTGLSLADVILILFECRGGITALEIFNFKDHLRNLDHENTLMNDLRHALNAGNVVQLKSLLLRAIDEVKGSDAPDRELAAADLRRILRKLPELARLYARAPLDAVIGSDSAGKAAQPDSGAGMGFAVINTLDKGVRKKILKEKRRPLLPVHSTVFKQVSYLPAGKFAPQREQSEYVCHDPASAMDKTGNLISLGFCRKQRPSRGMGSLWAALEENFHYLNSNLKIALKICAGFTAAFLTFYLSGAWWVLAWFGAPIWLGITLFRNVVQFRIASGTFRSNPLLKWNEFISWQRISDSLFFTGLSVPLLDFVVKNLIMRQTFGITTENNPMLLYSTMGLANGLYITTHNLLRALPAQAILGNWLRVPLAIPIAFTINALLSGLLQLCGLAGAEALLQQWAAVISKFSSDCVGGVVEALADRAMYLRSRMGDFKRKKQDLFNLAADLELITPEKGVDQLLAGNVLFENALVRESSLMVRVYLNALDLMYIWMRQPRAPQVISRILQSVSPEERRFYLAVSQQLKREKEISALLESGLFGGGAPRVLGFYRRAYKLYLAETAFLAPEKKR